MADSTPTSPTSAAGNALQVVRQLGDLWGRQPRGRKLVAIVLALGVIGGIAWTTVGHHVESWSVAIDGIAPEDAQEVYGALIARGLPARLREGKVEVHDGDLDQARAIAASAGLPFSGKGFELFDGNSLGQSSFAEQVNYRRALQGELARSITTLAQVESARVHLAIGKHSVFKDQEVAPSASVALHLHLGQSLTPEQVRGIRQLVAASLEGLKPEAVAILDGHGNLLDSHDPTSSTRAADLEHGVADRVRTMLERVVGAGHVSVVASADIDSRQINETEDTYDKDRAVIRSESRTVEGNDVGAKSATDGVAALHGNLTGSTPAAGTPGVSGPGRTQETRNFEISHKIVQTSNPEQTLRRLHVAVLVDEAKDAKGVAVVRTPEQLAELTALARQAAGLDEARGDIMELRSVQFAPTEDSAAVTAAADPAVAAFPLPLPLPILIGAGAGVLVLMTVVVLMVRRARRRRRNATGMTHSLAFPTPVAELERVLEARASAVGPGDAAESLALPASPTRSVQDRVTQVVRADVARAAGVLTAWLAQPAPAAAHLSAKGAK